MKLAGARRISCTITIPVDQFLEIDLEAAHREVSFAHVAAELLKLGTTYRKLLDDQEKLKDPTVAAGIREEAREVIQNAREHKEEGS